MSHEAWERAWAGEPYGVNEPDEDGEGDDEPAQTAPPSPVAARPSGPTTMGEKIALGAALAGVALLLVGGLVVAPILNKRIL